MLSWINHFGMFLTYDFVPIWALITAVLLKWKITFKRFCYTEFILNFFGESNWYMLIVTLHVDNKYISLTSLCLPFDGRAQTSTSLGLPVAFVNLQLYNRNISVCIVLTIHNWSKIATFVTFLDVKNPYTCIVHVALLFIYFIKMTRLWTYQL